MCYLVAWSQFETRDRLCRRAYKQRHPDVDLQVRTEMPSPAQTAGILDDTISVGLLRLGSRQTDWSSRSSATIPWFPFSPSPTVWRPASIWTYGICATSPSSPTRAGPVSPLVRGYLDTARSILRTRGSIVQAPILEDGVFERPDMV